MKTYKNIVLEQRKKQKGKRFVGGRIDIPKRRLVEFTKADDITLSEWKHFLKVAYSPVFIFHAYWDTRKYKKEEVKKQIKKEAEEVFASLQGVLTSYFKERNIEILLKEK